MLKKSDFWVALFVWGCPLCVSEAARATGTVPQSRSRHPCSLGPRHPWRGPLCSTAPVAHLAGFWAAWM